MSAVITSVTLSIKQEGDCVMVDAKATWKECGELKPGIVAEYTVKEQSWVSDKEVIFDDVMKNLSELTKQLLDL